MTHVATLISNPAAPALDEATLARAAAACSAASSPRWLDPGIAADLPFSAGRAADKDHVIAALRDTLVDRAIDIIVQPVAHRRKRLLVADMDSTMIGQECIDELADTLGLKAQVAAITERAMRGDIEFAPALRERVALLKDLPARVIDGVLASRISLTPGGPTLVRTMRANGAYTYLVSGGFSLFAERIAAMIGFDESRANRLIVADGRLTGQVEEPVLGADAKLAALREVAALRGIAAAQTLAVGDGANDLAMLGAAGLGVAYRAKPVVAAKADARIEHGDLTALLYLQGYRREEFIPGPQGR
jgi:phosphoserine phosphatase